MSVRSTGVTIFRRMSQMRRHGGRERMPNPFLGNGFKDLSLRTLSERPNVDLEQFGYSERMLSSPK